MARLQVRANGAAWPLWRLLGVCAVALTTANCAGNPQKYAAGSSSDIDPKYGVKASKRVYNEGDVIPKGGGRRFSGKPYVVAGRTYVPREDARGYVREGLASWYGAAFHGRVTANGEVFDRQSIAAAHPTLPLPSYARVTNLDNGYSMVVRVNDRGPYHANRVMDVSEETARALEFHRKGTAHVRVEYVGKASTAGSDDRKLLATLRTDGSPALVGSRGPVMVADLGPDAPGSDSLSRSTARPLAFKPRETEPSETAGTDAAPTRPSRPAPVVLASAAHVNVPSAVQPTASRGGPFQPVRTAALSSESMARVPTSAHGNAPLRLAPLPIRLASATSVKPIAVSSSVVSRVSGSGAMPSSRAGSAAAMPSASKLAMARLAAASGALASASQKDVGKVGQSGPRRDRVAAVY